MAAEKEGTLTNTSRLVQWHDKVCDPPGDSRSDLWFIYHLGQRLKQLYAESAEPRDTAIQALTWKYPVSGDTCGAGCGSSPARDQRLHRRRSQAGQELPGTQGRRQHGLRWLDVLCGIFPGQHDNRSRSRSRTARRALAATRAGPSHGPTIAAPCTIVHLLTSTESPGQSASGWCGGMTAGEVDRQRHARLRADQTARHATRLEQAAAWHGRARRR